MSWRHGPLGPHIHISLFSSFFHLRSIFINLSRTVAVDDFSLKHQSRIDLLSPLSSLIHTSSVRLQQQGESIREKLSSFSPTLIVLIEVHLLANLDQIFHHNINIHSTTRDCPHRHVGCLVFLRTDNEISATNLHLFAAAATMVNSSPLESSIKNILLLDSEGNRVAVKYYSDEWPTESTQSAFEKNVFTKTQKTNARTEVDIAIFEDNIVVYKFIQDLHFFVTGSKDDSELILVTVLQAFFDSIALILRGNVDKREALENVNLIYLCLDELVDEGIILETEANIIAEKVTSYSVDASAPLSEQSIIQALTNVHEQFTRSLLS